NVVGEVGRLDFARHGEGRGAANVDRLVGGRIRELRAVAGDADTAHPGKGRVAGPDIRVRSDRRRRGIRRWVRSLGGRLMPAAPEAGDDTDDDREGGAGPKPHLRTVL